LGYVLDLKSVLRTLQVEFEETILEDLTLLDIRGDAVTHTSDHFDTLHEYAVKLIKSGKAYADDTEQQQVEFSLSQIRISSNATSSDAR